MFFFLTHFTLVNMLQQVANFSGISSPRYLHIKRVGGRPRLRVRGVAGSCASSSGGYAWVCPRRRRPRSAMGPWEAGAAAAGHLGRREGTGPSSECTRLRPPPLHRPEPPPALNLGRGRPRVPHARKGRARIYPQVRLLNRVWRWMDVDTREEIAALS